MIDDILYCNDGDWVESLTALVEDMNGELRIVHWPIILEDKKESLTMNVEIEINQTVISMGQPEAINQLEQKNQIKAETV
jgi:hypothetical protein